MKDLCHWRACHISAFLRQTAVGKVSSCVFAVCEVDIADNIHDSAVGFFRQTLVLAAISGFHVENRNMQALCRNSRQTRICITEDKHRIGLDLVHQLVRAVDDISDRCAKIITNSVHVNFGISELQVLEKHTVKVVIVILTGMCQNTVKILSALVDNGRKSDDLGTSADDYQQL